MISTDNINTNCSLIHKTLLFIPEKTLNMSYVSYDIKYVCTYILCPVIVQFQDVKKLRNVKAVVPESNYIATKLSQKHRASWMSKWRDFFKYSFQQIRQSVRLCSSHCARCQTGNEFHTLSGYGCCIVWKLQWQKYTKILREQRK